MLQPCVIFDLDGVLVDSYQAHLESWRGVAAEEGVVVTEAEFARSFGRTSREIIRATWPVPVTDEAVITAIDTRKEDAFRRIIRHECPVMDGAPELIATLQASGFRLAIGSSAPPENVNLALEKLGRHLFDGVVNGMDVERGKPDPQVFLLAAARAGVEPCRCVVIEDARYGVEAAGRAGMASVAFVSTGRREDDFQALHPDLVIHSLHELSPAILRALADPAARAARGRE
jgi:beta-phosphoglucomutase